MHKNINWIVFFLTTILFNEIYKSKSNYQPPKSESLQGNSDFNESLRSIRNTLESSPYNDLTKTYNSCSPNKEVFASKLNFRILFFSQHIHNMPSLGKLAIQPYKGWMLPYFIEVFNCCSVSNKRVVWIEESSVYSTDRS